MKPSISSFVSLVLLILAGWQMVAALARTPAFNPSLRVESPEGRTFLGYATTMYDRGTYYRWMAASWEGYGIEYNETDDPAVVEDGLQRMRDIATRSLTHAPGNPSSWMQLAVADAELGRPEKALVAFKTAQTLTPNSENLAVARIAFLAELMNDPEARAVALSTLEPAMVDADLRLLGSDRYRAGMARGAWDMFVGYGIDLPDLPEE